MSASPLRRSRAALDLAVVGGGVVGAALALALLRTGRRVALVEARLPEPPTAAAPDLRVYALAPDSIALLAGLGVWSTVTAGRVRPYRRMRVWDAGGEGELAFDADALGRPSLGAIVEHGLLLDALWQALRHEPGLTLQAPARVEAIESRECALSLLLDDGTRLQAALAVAADGADSSLRELGGITVKRKDYGQRGIVGYVDSELPHQDTAWQRFLPGGPLAMLPCVDPDHPGSDRRSSIVWTVSDGEAQRLLALDDASFDAELTRAFDARLGTLRSASPRVAFPLRRQLASRFVEGRLLLVGDAAHAVHPLAGQGVNLGLRDVSCLCRLLADRDLHAAAIAHPLARYARERRSESALAAHAFDGINRLFSNDALLPTLLRGPALGAVSGIEPLRQFFARRALGG